MTDRFGCTYQFCDFCGRRNDCKIFCEYHKAQPQLTEAKEIIREYVRLANLEKEDTVAIWQLYHKAEAFLKE